eukprot:5986783-Pleurochrysis_carterae.AAC.1
MVGLGAGAGGAGTTAREMAQFVAAAVEEMATVDAVEAALLAARGRGEDGEVTDERGDRMAAAGMACVEALRH